MRTQALKNQMKKGQHLEKKLLLRLMLEKYVTKIK